MTPPFANTQEMVTWLRKKLVREVIQQWLGTNGLEQLEAIADTLEAQQWQPIETAPKDGTVIIGALSKSGRIFRIQDMAFNGIGFYSIAGNGCHWATHWLPAPPTEAK